MAVVRMDSRPVTADASGAYLTFDCASHGTLTLTWSKKALTEAILYFQPKKNVPNFKYTTNGGRVQLSANVQADHRRYYQGICAFLKVAKQYDGELTILEATGPKPTAVCLHLCDGNGVVKCERNVAYDLSRVDAVAAVPAECPEFDCKTLTVMLFQQKGDRAGASLQVS